MEQSLSWETNSLTANQETHFSVWNPMIITMPQVPILSHMYPVHTFPSYVPDIRSIIILLSMSTSFEWPHLISPTHLIN